VGVGCLQGVGIGTGGLDGGEIDNEGVCFEKQWYCRGLLDADA
jgi:hypothetical protein